MSWNYLPASAVPAMPGSLSETGEQSVMSNGINTVSKSSDSDSETGYLTMPQYGMTCKPSTGSRGLDEWISSLVGSRASRSASQESKKGLTMKGTCGLTPSESLARYDRDSHSWRTYQLCLLPGTLDESLETYPKSGMIVDGLLYQLPTLEHLTCGKGSGSWPTPASADQRSGCQEPDGRRGLNLITRIRGAAKHRTPTTTNRGQYDGGTSTRQTYPTPGAADHRDRGGPKDAAIQRRKAIGKSIELTMTVDGSLNPSWVEWLMGYPIGATVLKGLAMPGFRRWLAQHGQY